ncbi:MAG TPA: shikimate dehydrogenase [Kofleriaceae bacterium]|nr:shikimate dehydrogenase [Kofleriaceae bacterium]
MTSTAVISGTTRVAAVIGDPVAHSRSPQMFAAAFAATGIDAVMIPIAVRDKEFATVVHALRAMHALGASVTLPHKLAAAALCDELTPAALEIGAVNCLWFHAGRIFGDNTDCVGYTDALAAAGFAIAGAHCTILGAGGAARGVAYGLRTAGAASIDVIARRPDAVHWTTATPWQRDAITASFTRARLVVDATPISLGAGHGGDDAFADLPLLALAPEAWVTSLVYHRQGGLLERASARGHSILDGRGMLVHQGARAFAQWTARAAPIEAMRRALDASLTGT